MTSDESWVMKFYVCMLKGLVWLQAPETSCKLLESANQETGLVTMVLWLLVL